MLPSVANLPGRGFPADSEQNLHRELGDARIPGLASPECSEGGIVIQFVERADLIGAVDRSRADALGSKVRMVQNIKVLASELEPQTLRHREVL
jgi:hypothetical protein